MKSLALSETTSHTLPARLREEEGARESNPEFGEEFGRRVSSRHFRDTVVLNSWQLWLPPQHY